MSTLQVMGCRAHPSREVTMLIPSMLLKKLYTLGSLKNAEQGVQFALKNRLSDAELTGLRSIVIDGRSTALSEVTLELADGKTLIPGEISAANPLAFPLRATVLLQTRLAPLPLGMHEIEIAFETRPFGKLQFKVEDTISEHEVPGIRIPRDANDDYGDTVIKQRQALVEQVSGTRPEHIWKYSFDPHATKGNIENFTGVAQVPIGFAGPLRINGERAQGDFIVPMATTEGTL